MITNFFKRIFCIFARFYGWHSPFNRGKERLRIILKSQGLFDSEVEARGKFGLKMKLDLSQYLQQRIYLEGCYEEKLLKMIGKIAKQTDRNLFVDIGANVGLYDPL